jgi:hypothetical protein
MLVVLLILLPPGRLARQSKKPQAVFGLEAAKIAGKHLAGPQDLPLRDELNRAKYPLDQNHTADWGVPVAIVISIVIGLG